MLKNNRVFQINYKEVINKLVNFWGMIVLILPLRILKKYNLRGEVTERLFIGLCNAAEKNTSCYVSVNLRPKTYEDKCSIPSHKTSKSIAVVMQGPLLLDEHFTLETVKLYKNNPAIKHVIVSTWNGENVDEMRKIKEAGAIVLSSQLPVKHGLGNINYQLKSTQIGVKAAQELGAEYICKTRTDQRIYNEFAFAGMINLLTLFPSSARFEQNQRLLILPTYVEDMFFPYYLSDFLYFGTTDELSKFLKIKFDFRMEKTKFIDYSERVKNESNAEIYFIKEYMKVSGGGYGDTIEEYWNFVKDALIIIDRSQIGLYWKKYANRFCEHKRSGEYFPIINENRNPKAKFSFFSWLSLYNGELEYKDSYELETTKKGKLE